MHRAEFYKRLDNEIHDVLGVHEEEEEEEESEAGVVRGVDLVAVGGVPHLVELLRDLHGERGQPHREHQAELGRVEAEERALGLAQAVQRAQPEQQQREEERRLEDGVEDAGEQRRGREGQRVEGVVVEEEEQEQDDHPPLLHGPVQDRELVQPVDEEHQDAEGEGEEEEPDCELELCEGRVVSGPGEHEVPHGVAVPREAQQRGSHEVHAVRQLAQVQQDDRLAVRARTLQRPRPGGRVSHFKHQYYCKATSMAFTVSLSINIKFLELLPIVFPVSDNVSLLQLLVEADHGEHDGEVLAEGLVIVLDLELDHEPQLLVVSAQPRRLHHPGPRGHGGRAGVGEQLRGADLGPGDHVRAGRAQHHRHAHQREEDSEGEEEVLLGHGVEPQRDALLGLGVPVAPPPAPAPGPEVPQAAQQAPALLARPGQVHVLGLAQEGVPGLHGDSWQYSAPGTYLLLHDDTCQYLAARN